MDAVESLLERDPDPDAASSALSVKASQDDPAAKAVVWTALMSSPKLRERLQKNIACGSCLDATIAANADARRSRRPRRLVKELNPHEERFKAHDAGVVGLGEYIMDGRQKTTAGGR